MRELTASEFAMITAYVRDRYGINLDKKQYLIESKLCFEAARCKASSYTEYWNMLRADPTGDLERRMIDRLTTNYTFFCREQKHFQFLHDLLQQGKLGGRPGAALSFWSAGCSTGQECFTLAMWLEDCRLAGLLKGDYRILGSDLSSQAVATACKASYPAADYARLDPAWQARYCSAFSQGQFTVNDSLRSHVAFERTNLLESPLALSAFDVVFCRNVLIYFNEQDRIRLVARLAQTIRPGGYLFVGHTETLLECPAGLAYVKPAIYRKEGAAW